MEELLYPTQNTIPIIEIVARLGLAALLGMVLGIERERRNRPAGLRTHMLVALAAAVFTVITFEIYAEAQKLEARGSVTADPIRIIEAVTAGVAFLAAGTIIQARGSVHGLTTGASVWLTGAIGTACGVGYYAIAFIVVMLALPILMLLHALGRRINPTEDT